MTRKKFITVFVMMVSIAFFLEVRLFFLMNNSVYTEAAASQGLYTKTVSVHRPDFYDCNGLPLTGTTTREYAVANPQDGMSYNILKYIDDPDEEAFREQMGEGVPFLVPVDHPLDGEPIETVQVRDRYTEDNLAKHLIGYLGYDANGVSGLEYVLDRYLTEHATQTMLSVQVNALGRAIDGAAINVYEEGAYTARVALTIDRSIQSAIEQIANDSLPRGAIVVLNAETFEVCAMASRPDFNQNDIVSALAYDNGALLNRAVNAFNIGSVYKPLVAAAALEAGVSTDYGYQCNGEIEVNGHIYTCNEGKAHGYVDMESAIIHSCNCYFIALGQKIGAAAVYNMAINMGLGKPLSAYDGFHTARGYMPTMSELDLYGELCNNCFGQGKLLATPLHVAAYTACLANGGVMRNVSVIKQIGDETVTSAGQKQILSQEHARFIANSMRLAVEQGTGVQGIPNHTTAAGKTGTAQTGVFNENGTEKYIGWFTGWFPAENPRYVVTVMTENAGYSYEAAAPIFKQIADAITLLQLT